MFNKFFDTEDFVDLGALIVLLTFVVGIGSIFW
jgi:hypothetical protein